MPLRSNSESNVDYAPTPQVANHKQHHLSPAASKPDEDLPTSVCDPNQLADLPLECLSDDFYRPLRHVDDRGFAYEYSLNPMLYSVAFILVVELLERFAFYGIYYTQTLYLTGVYNEEWNAGLSSVDAASFVSVSTAVAYTTPFVGAILADSILGDYRSIVVGSIGLYLPGLILVTLTTVPNLLGRTFNTTCLSIAVLGLWPMGTGIIKSVINVFGAKQFHPILQSSMIERYYVNFYMSINIGALAGITLIPILAQHSVTQAYAVPCIFLAIGIVVFLCGTSRYVTSQPRGDLLQLQLGVQRSSKKKNAVPEPPPTSTTIPLTTVFRISLLIVPFCIAYSQMPTTFIVQGTVMRKALGVVDAATMNSLDALSVLIFGWITGNIIYPQLAKRNIRLPTTYKFALGSLLGALAIGWALLVEYWIHQTYNSHANKTNTTAGALAGIDEEEQDGDPRISVLWQAPAYILIGWGEIFAVSAAYEVAFTASAPQTKALASAVNIFCVGGIPNVICIGLYQACEAWFQNSHGNTNLQHLEDYATAHVNRYFGVLLLILIVGICLNISNPIRRFVESTEQQAAELVKTPIILRKLKVVGIDDDDEESPLLKAQQHQKYLDYGKGPVLYKLGSMRAGPSLSHKESKPNAIKKSYIPQLYAGPPDPNNNERRRSPKSTTTTTSSTTRTKAPKLAHRADSSL